MIIIKRVYKLKVNVHFSVQNIIAVFFHIIIIIIFFQQKELISFKQLQKERKI